MSKDYLNEIIIRFGFGTFLSLINFQVLSIEYVRVTVADITSSEREKIMKAAKQIEKIVERFIGRNLDVMVEINSPARIIFSSRPPTLDLMIINTNNINLGPEWIKLQKYISGNKLWRNLRTSTYLLTSDKIAFN